MSHARTAGRRGPTSRGRRRRAEHVDRARARADPAQPAAHRRRGHRLGARGPPRAARGRAPAAPPAPRSACSRAVRGAVGVALARDLHEPLAVEEDVAAGLAVAAGDHHRAGPERVDRARELARRRRPRPSPASAARLRQVGRDDRGPRAAAARAARARRRARAAGRRSRRPSPGRARPARRRDQVERLDPRPRSSRRCRACRSSRRPRRCPRPPPAPARRSPRAAAGRPP